MYQSFLIAVIAGLCAALFYSATIIGNTSTTFLLYLSSLPIYAVGLTRGQSATLTALLSSSIALVMFSGFLPAVVFIALFSGPAAWFVHLLLLSQQTADQTEHIWYPPERVLCWMAVLACIGLTIFFHVMGGETSFLRNEIHGMVENLMATNPAIFDMQPGNMYYDADRLTEILLFILPTLAVTWWIFTHILCLYLAARIAYATGQLQRPWPPLAMIRVPRGATIAMLATLIIASLSSDMTHILFMAATASFMLVHLLVGFSVLHMITRDISYRPLLLGGVYLASLLLGWPFIAVTLLAIADSMFNLRSMKLIPSDNPRNDDT